MHRPTRRVAAFFALLSLLPLVACGKSHIQAMSEMEAALFEADEAARAGELERMRSELTTLLALLEEPNVVKRIDEPAYEAMRANMMRLVRELHGVQTAEEAKKRVQGLYPACDSCHAVWGARRYAR